jgi:hypothetical protein
VVVVYFKVDLLSKHLDREGKITKSRQSKFPASVPRFPKRDVPGMKQECQSVLNLTETRYDDGRRAGSKTWLSELFSLRLLLQNSIGVTRQRQYMEQGETAIRTSCPRTVAVQKPRYVATYLQRHSACFHNHVLHATPPDLQPSTYLQSTKAII